jgi:hypothetical protein
MTANARDFGKLAEFRPFLWRVEIRVSAENIYSSPGA